MGSKANSNADTNFLALFSPTSPSCLDCSRHDKFSHSHHHRHRPSFFSKKEVELPSNMTMISIHIFFFSFLRSDIHTYMHAYIHLSIDPSILPSCSGAAHTWPRPTKSPVRRRIRQHRMVPSRHAQPNPRQWDDGGWQHCSGGELTRRASGR